MYAKKTSVATLALLREIIGVWFKTETPTVGRLGQLKLGKHLKIKVERIKRVKNKNPAF